MIKKRLVEKLMIENGIGFPFVMLVFLILPWYIKGRNSSHKWFVPVRFFSADMKNMTQTGGSFRDVSPF
jgi:hypothetical protein